MRAAYDGIYFDLKRSIEDGEYRYKDFLPSEATLIKKYSCAHNTVRKAISILAREGYVQPIHGKGVRIIYKSSPILFQRRSMYELQGIESFSDIGKRQGFSTRTKVLSMETVEASDELAASMGFEAGARLVHLERARSLDGRAVARESNYFRSDIVEGMTVEDAEKSVYHYIEVVRGAKLVTNKRLFAVERANEQDRELIAMGDSQNVLVITTVTYDGEGLVCEVTESRHHPDSFTFTSTTLRTRVSRRNG